MPRQRSGPSRADWADPRRLAALADELRHTGPRPRPSRWPHDRPRPRDETGRVLSALKVTIRLGGSGTVRYFDSWPQLASYLAGDDFGGIAGEVRSILVNHRPRP
jgi:hypothetical protein